MTSFILKTVPVITQLLICNHLAFKETENVETSNVFISRILNEYESVDTLV